MVVKTSISLKDSIFKMAADKSNKLFSGNFSAYIGYLISMDHQGEAPRKSAKNKKVLSSIDDILSI